MKRTIALLLAIVMVLGMIPTFAMAEEASAAASLPEGVAAEDVLGDYRFADFTAYDYETVSKDVEDAEAIDGYAVVDTASCTPSKLLRFPLQMNLTELSSSMATCTMQAWLKLWNPSWARLLLSMSP